MPFEREAAGFAYYQHPFAEGAERLVYRFHEITEKQFRSGQYYALIKGKKLVCKEAKIKEHEGSKVGSRARSP